MLHDNWAVVWSDKEEIEKITNASAGQLTKWKERILAGEASLKLPYIEYTTGHVESKLPLDFERETTLINSLEPLNDAQFLEKLHERKPFRPFVAMLEGTFLLAYNAVGMFRCRWEYLKQVRLVGDESSQKIDSFLQRPIWEFEALYEKGEDPIITFDRKLIKEAELRNANANQMVTMQLLKEKPVNMVEYDGKTYLVISFKKADQEAIQEPTILFPQSSRGSIPNASSFYGRICGIVNFVANPPPLHSNVVLQSVILALPVRYQL
jgi:hypothetical protein